jgi:hypothetical protein
MEVRKKAIHRVKNGDQKGRAQAPFEVATIIPAPRARKPSGFSETPPALDPSITQVFLPVEHGEKESIRRLARKVGRDVDIVSSQLVYKPAILGGATVRFVDRKRKIDEQVDKILLVAAPEDVGSVNWKNAEEPPINFRDLSTSPERVSPDVGTLFAPAPKQANSAREIRRISKNLDDWLYYNSRLPVRVHLDLGIFQQPGESERQFIIRLQQAARERRDEDVDKLEEKYGRKLDKMAKKKRKLELELVADEKEYEARKREEMVGVGETVLSFFMGRRRTSAATTIARRRRMTSKVKLDIQETKEEMVELKEDITKIESELTESVNEITRKWDEALDDLTTEELKPRRSDVNVQVLALAWLPFWLITYDDEEFPRITTIPAYPHSEST